MKSDEEILARMKEREPYDWMGIEREDLIVFLSFEAAQPYLSKVATKESWEAAGCPESQEPAEIIDKIEKYLPFAWDKANNFRGISASRSMKHFSTWVWMLGDDLGELTDYEYYGKDNLVKIGEYYGFGSDWDDGVRQNTE